MSVARIVRLRETGIVTPLGNFGLGVYSSSGTPENIQFLMNEYERIRTDSTTYRDDPLKQVNDLNNVLTPLVVALKSDPVFSKYPAGTSTTITVPIAGKPTPIKLMSIGTRRAMYGFPQISAGHLRLTRPDGYSYGLKAPVSLPPGQTFEQVVSTATFYPPEKSQGFFSRLVTDVKLLAKEPSLLPVAAILAPAIIGVATAGGATTTGAAKVAAAAAPKVAAAAAPVAAPIAAAAAPSIMTGGAAAVTAAAAPSLLQTALQTGVQLAPQLISYEAAQQAAGGAPQAEATTPGAAPSGMANLGIPLAIAAAILFVMMNK